MARPRKEGLDYFPLDVDFFNDEKITAIAGEFGLKGEITAIKLLCAIYRNGYFTVWNELLKFKLLKDLPGVSADLLESIVNRLVLWGFFDKALFDSVEVLTSRGIQRRYFEAVKRRATGENLPYLLIGDGKDGVSVCNNGVNVNKNPTAEDLMSTKTPQSKEKESKEKNKETKKRAEDGKTVEEKCRGTFDFFNQMTDYYKSSIKPVRVYTEERRRKIEAVVQRFTAEQIARAIGNAMTSDYLNGRTPRRKLPADFDWIFDMKNFVRIYEGSV